MADWIRVLTQAATQDKRVVLRKPKLKADGTPYANGQHDIFYVVQSSLKQAERNGGKFESARTFEELAGRPNTLKFVTKEEKNSDNNIRNNRKNDWTLVHYSGIEALALTPVDGELLMAAEWQELAQMADLSIETVKQVRQVAQSRSQGSRPITTWFKGTEKSPAEPSEKGTEATSNQLTVPDTQAGTSYQTEDEGHEGDTESCVEDNADPEEDLEVLNNLVELCATPDQQLEAATTVEIEPSAAILLSSRVQEMGRLQASLDVLKESMMNHIIQIGDGAPPVIPIAKPIICPSLFRVADEELITALNEILYDCSERCSKALVFAEERAVKSIQDEIDELARDWDQSPEEKEAIRRITKARKERTKLKKPRSLANKLEFYKLPSEGDLHIPSCNAQSVNESKDKIQGSKSNNSQKKPISNSSKGKGSDKNSNGKTPKNKGKTSKRPVSTTIPNDKSENSGKKLHNTSAKKKQKQRRKKSNHKSANGTDHEGVKGKGHQTQSTPKSAKSTPKKPLRTPKNSLTIEKEQKSRQNNQPRNQHQGYPWWQQNAQSYQSSWVRPRRWQGPGPSRYPGQTYNQQDWYQQGGQRQGYQRYQNGYQNVRGPFNGGPAWRSNGNNFYQNY
jgi:hypothetical protein